MICLPNIRRHPRRFSQHGFTIIEVMVVVAVIGLLLGILLPTLSSVRKSAAKNREQNNIRQVYKAWAMYATYNNEATLPGYLDTDVQARWRLKYEYPNDTFMPPAPNYGAGDPNVAGPWTWRLLHLLDYSHEIVHGYHDDEEFTMLDIHDPANVGEALEIAESPSFGYNGFYVGGYWRMSADGSPRYDFFDHCHRDIVDGAPVDHPLVVATSVSNVRRSTEVILFCSATRTTAAGVHGPYPDDVTGSHLITGPIVGETVVWTSRGTTSGEQSDLGPNQVNVLAIPFTGEAYLPLARVTQNAVAVYADGHIAQEGYNALDDQRKWIDTALTARSVHDPAYCPPVAP